MNKQQVVIAIAQSSAMKAYVEGCSAILHGLGLLPEEQIALVLGEGRKEKLALGQAALISTSPTFNIMLRGEAMRHDLIDIDGEWVIGE